jgi:hypothetical protein
MHPEAWLSTTIEAAAGCNAYPVMGREGVPVPYVVFMREGTTDDLTLDQAYGDVGVTTATFSVDIYADSYLQAKDLAAAVRAAIRNFSGSASGITIIRATAEDDRDGSPVLLDGRDIPTYTIEQSYQISWRDT